MLKSTTKSDNIRREEKRKLLQKKLSKDSVTSTKFYDSSEEREAGSNTSSNVSAQVLGKLNNISDLNDTKADSFFCDKKFLLKGSHKKLNKSYLQNFDSVNTFDNINNTSSNKINNEKQKNGNKCLDESNIPTKIDIYRVEENTDILKKNETLIENSGKGLIDIEDNNNNYLNKEINLSSNFKNSFFNTYNFEESLIDTENNQLKNINNNSYLYSNNNCNSQGNNINLSEVENFKSYPLSSYNYNYKNNNTSFIDTNYNPYFNNDYSSYSNNEVNSYSDNNLNCYPFNSFKYCENNNSILVSNNNNIEKSSNNNTYQYIDNSVHVNKQINKEKVFFDENYQLNKENQMDFLNMYNSSTPIGSNNINMNDSCQYMNENPYTINNGYMSNNKENVLTRNINYSNTVNSNIYDDNAISNMNLLNLESIPNNNKVETGYMGPQCNAFDQNKVNNRIFDPNLIKENEHMKNEITISENISSHTDYSRATHSSHVVDKRIVHEGFDTIKIPKYREVEIVEKIVEVPVVHKVNKYVNKYEIKEVEKVIKKPIKKFIETKIEVPELHYQDKIVEVPEMHEVVKIIEKPEIKERIIYKNKIETKIIPKYIEVPVVKIVNKYEEYDDIEEVIKPVPVKKIVEVPNEIIKKVKVPQKKIIEKPNYIPIIKYRDVPIEKIRYVPKIETVELVKKVPKIIDVPVPVKIPKIKIIDKPYYINKYIDKPVVVPVSKRIKPIYKYEGKKIIEIPVHKPYIVTHDTLVPRKIEDDFYKGRCSVYTKKLDLNSFSPMKRNELFNLVNKNNLNLNRSVSVDNLYNNENNIVNRNKDDNGINLNNSSRIRNNNDEQIYLNNNLSNLKFSKSMNANMNNCNSYSPNNINSLNMLKEENNMFYSNKIQNDNNFNNSLNNNNAVRMNYNRINPLVNNVKESDKIQGNECKYDINFGKNIKDYNIPFNKINNNIINYTNNMNYSNKLPYSLNNSNTIYNMNKMTNGLNNSIKKYQEDVWNEYQPNAFSNVVNNNYGSSNNLSNIYDLNKKNFMRSRSPSICSADGISAYAVEYVGEQNNLYNMGPYNGEINSNIREEMGSNYSFSGALNNEIGK